MNPVDRVRHLVETGAVAPEEGARLVAAMGRAPAGSWLRMVVDPFERFGGGTAAVAGIVVCTLGLAASRFGARFDGFLDLHASSAQVPPFGVSLLEQAAVWPLPALMFWGYARVSGGRARVVDFLGMIGLARLPLSLAGAPIALLTPAKVVFPLHATPGLVALVPITIVSVVWCFTWLTTGFRNASGLRGSKLAVGLIATAIAAEIASKVVLALIL